MSSEIQYPKQLAFHQDAETYKPPSIVSTNVDVREWTISHPKSYEAEYADWGRSYSTMPPSTQKAAVFVRNHPDDWHRPEFAGHLLKETRDPFDANRQMLMLMPRPLTAFMPLEQFWASEIDLEDIADGLHVLTRHGLRKMNLKRITDWLMEVDDGNKAGLEILEKANQQMIFFEELGPLRSYLLVPRYSSHGRRYSM